MKCHTNVEKPKAHNEYIEMSQAIDSLKLFARLLRNEAGPNINGDSYKTKFHEYLTNVCSCALCLCGTLVMFTCRKCLGHDPRGRQEHTCELFYPNFNLLGRERLSAAMKMCFHQGIYGLDLLKNSLKMQAMEPALAKAAQKQKRLLHNITMEQYSLEVGQMNFTQMAEDKVAADFQITYGEPSPLKKLKALQPARSEPPRLPVANASASSDQHRLSTSDLEASGDEQDLSMCDFGTTPADAPDSASAAAHASSSGTESAVAVTVPTEKMNLIMGKMLKKDNCRIFSSGRTCCGSISRKLDHLAHEALDYCSCNKCYKTWHEVSPHLMHHASMGIPDRLAMGFANPCAAIPGKNTCTHLGSKASLPP